MPTKVLDSQRNLKFKITTKGIRIDKSQDGHAEALVKNSQKVRVSGNGSKPSMPPAKSLKRKPEVSLDGHSDKKAKMDPTLKFHCGNILKQLMCNEYSYIFREPVDPVKLNIPDYFSIITKPMDLGTVKRKLEGNMYFAAEGFAADVKLTFSNATTYNREGDLAHKVAKQMNSVFCRRWKSLEAKLKQMKENDEKENFVHNVEKNGQVTKKGTGNNHQGIKPTGLYKKTIDTSPDDISLWKLRSKVSVMDKTRTKVKPAKTALNVCSWLRRTVPKEPLSQSVSVPAKQSRSVGSAQAKCSSCVSVSCHSRLKNGPAQASKTTSDLSWERLPENSHFGDPKHDYEVELPLASHRSSFSQETDGPGVVIHEEKSPHLSTPSTTGASGEEGWTSVDVRMSPDKSLRVALLKSRFADTIFKATHQVEKSDSLPMRQEKERLEREKKREKERIDAEIRAAEAASRRREQNVLKMKRESDRAAARMAIQEMEKTVVIYDTMDIMKDVEMLCFGSERGKFLEKLGLFFKGDYMEEDEDAILNAEEGEILS